MSFLCKPILSALPLQSKPIMSAADQGTRHYLLSMLDVLEVQQSSSETFSASLPFAGIDATAGTENELQAVVIGRRNDVDLPITITQSNYYRNILKRVRTGETPQKVFTALEEYLQENQREIWENSWVRFPRSVLSSFANRVLKHDLLADKSNPGGPGRGDMGKFLYTENGEEFLRIPVSYLLKLALADTVSFDFSSPPLVQSIGERVLPHFSNDNTSPETFSFHPVRLHPGQMGKALSRETSIRFLLTQFLTLYANQHFQLQARGQKAMVYFAPHPPTHQILLNELISDSFYRELFMSPCLSGWDRGEEKHHYMVLCHQVLSRSYLNAVAKLKDAGIITSNLIVMPKISNTSLANNGTHVNLGSRKLTRLLRAGLGDFCQEDEKYLGDLVIKICEHFLPLFVGTYSGAPYRLDFEDFHPERALGFLPHELDYTHLRMIWRRWKKKANLKIFGQPITPFGPKWLDRTLSKIFRLQGDFVPDFRLLDYPVALMSTDQSPALDGRIGNDQRLKKDLADLGVFDPNMALYLLYRLRQFSTKGFSGFEGRHYSLFADLGQDLGEATSLQTLITALAFQYVLRGEITHAHIPDNPTLESERRQIFFGTAIGLPTFFIRKDTSNQFMVKILQKMERTRASRRYPGYIRAHNREYQKSLIQILKEDAKELIEVMGLQELLNGLENRVEDFRNSSTAGKLTRGILQAGHFYHPLNVPGVEFNLAAEGYYRNQLRIQHMNEGLAFLEDEFRKLDSHAFCDGCFYRETIHKILGGQSAAEFLAGVKKDLWAENISVEVLRKLIHLTLLTIHTSIQHAEQELSEERP